MTGWKGQKGEKKPKGKGRCASTSERTETEPNQTEKSQQGFPTVEPSFLRASGTLFSRTWRRTFPSGLFSPFPFPTCHHDTIKGSDLETSKSVIQTLRIGDSEKSEKQQVQESNQTTEPNVWRVWEEFPGTPHVWFDLDFGTAG